MLPATSQSPSSRHSAAAHSVVGPGTGSAPARRSSGEPSTLNFSGSTTSSAPSAAASRTSRSARARLRSFVLVGVELYGRGAHSASEHIDSRVNSCPEYKDAVVVSTAHVLLVNVGRVRTVDVGDRTIDDRDLEVARRGPRAPSAG